MKNKNTIPLIIISLIIIVIAGRQFGLFAIVPVNVVHYSSSCGSSNALYITTDNQSPEIRAHILNSLTTLCFNTDLIIAPTNLNVPSFSNIDLNKYSLIVLNPTQTIDLNSLTDINSRPILLIDEDFSQITFNGGGLNWGQNSFMISNPTFTSTIISSATHPVTNNVQFPIITTKYSYVLNDYMIPLAKDSVFNSPAIQIYESTSQLPNGGSKISKAVYYHSAINSDKLFNNSINWLVPCRTNWQCTSWSACSSGNQTRTCTDANSCGTIQDRPEVIRFCQNEPDDPDLPDEPMDYTIIITVAVISFIVLILIMGKKRR